MLRQGFLPYVIYVSTAFKMFSSGAITSNFIYLKTAFEPVGWNNSPVLQKQRTGRRRQSQVAAQHVAIYLIQHSPKLNNHTKKQIYKVRCRRKPHGAHRLLTGSPGGIHKDQWQKFQKQMKASRLSPTFSTTDNLFHSTCMQCLGGYFKPASVVQQRVLFIRLTNASWPPLFSYDSEIIHSHYRGFSGSSGDRMMHFTVNIHIFFCSCVIFF